MKAIIQILTSSLGKKYIMAVSGLGLVAFIIIHMLGNLQIFLGQDALNQYAFLLKSNAAVLWGFRIGILALIVIHVTAAIALARENRGARPRAYNKEHSLASYASRTMIWSGLIVFAFIIYHILHFTALVTQPEYGDMRAHLDGELVHDVYGMVVSGFSNPLISGFYILSVGLLCIHMSHGISSMFQSVGLRNRSTAKLLDLAAYGISAIIFLGMAAVPAAVLLNLV